MVAQDDDWGQVVQCRQGDPEAFATLIHQHQRMIHSLCYRMTGSLTEAEDLTQETFIQAHQHLGSYRTEARFSSWLYRIAVNLCLNWRKREQRRQRLSRQWSEQARAAEAHSDTPVHQVQEALLKLHPRQRAAIILTVYDGLNHAEAARVLGCSETTVSWRLFAARRKLRKLLHPHFSNQ